MDLLCRRSSVAPIGFSAFLFIFWIVLEKSNRYLCDTERRQLFCNTILFTDSQICLQTLERDIIFCFCTRDSKTPLSNLFCDFIAIFLEMRKCFFIRFTCWSMCDVTSVLFNFTLAFSEHIINIDYKYTWRKNACLRQANCWPEDFWWLLAYFDLNASVPEIIVNNVQYIAVYSCFTEPVHETINPNWVDCVNAFSWSMKEATATFPRPITFWRMFISL